MDTQPQPIESAAVLSSISAEFPWIDFYQSVADGIRSYKDRREDLAYAAYDIVNGVTGSTYLLDHFRDGTEDILKDICPFTVMGIFNRWLSDESRIKIAAELAKFLKVEKRTPDIFNGIPYLNNRNSWFFGFTSNPRKKEGDIDRLWDTFERAIDFADDESDDENIRYAFTKAFNLSMRQFHVKWNLTMGLYWIRPTAFPTLDHSSRNYIEKALGVSIGCNDPKGCCNARDYLSVLNVLKDGFKKGEYKNIDSFPALSLKAWG